MTNYKKHREVISSNEGLILEIENKYSIQKNTLKDFLLNMLLSSDTVKKSAEQISTTSKNKNRAFKLKNFISSSNYFKYFDMLTPKTINKFLKLNYKSPDLPYLNHLKYKLELLLEAIKSEYKQYNEYKNKKIYVSTKELISIFEELPCNLQIKINNFPGNKIKDNISKNAIKSDLKRLEKLDIDKYLELGNEGRPFHAVAHFCIIKLKTLFEINNIPYSLYHSGGNFYSFLEEIFHIIQHVLPKNHLVTYMASTGIKNYNLHMETINMS